MASLPTPIAARGARLVLEAEIRSEQEDGGHTVTHVPLATVWAELRWTGGGERRRAGHVEDAADTRISLRFRSGVAPGQRFRLGARLFHILAVGDPDGSRRRLVCLCEERAA